MKNALHCQAPITTSISLHVADADGILVDMLLPVPATQGYFDDFPEPEEVEPSAQGASQKLCRKMNLAKDRRLRPNICRQHSHPRHPHDKGADQNTTDEEEDGKEILANAVDAAAPLVPTRWHPKSIWAHSLFPLVIAAPCNTHACGKKRKRWRKLRSFLGKHPAGLPQKSSEREAEGRAGMAAVVGAESCLNLYCHRRLRKGVESSSIMKRKW